MSKVVVQADIDANAAGILAEGQPPMVLGDLLANTYWTTGNVYMNLSQGTYATVRANPTLWIDGTALNAIEPFEGFAVTAGEDRGDNFDGTITIRPLNGRVDIANLTLPYAQFSIVNIKNAIVQGETISYPGTRRRGSSKFLSGTLGFKLISNSGSIMNVDVQNKYSTLPTIKMFGIEASLGFAGFRLFQETKISAACTGGGSSTVLQDTVNDFTALNLFVGAVVRNVTDGYSTATIVSIDSATQITTTALTGGTDNTWTSGDTYDVGSFPIVDNVTIQRCYRHDAGGGEGTYIGTTQNEDAGHPRFNESIIKDNVLARCATEGQQMQQVGNLSKVSISEDNLTIGGVDWLSPFQPSQDNNSQFHVIDGNLRIRRSIFEGAGFSHIIFFGSDNANPSQTNVARLDGNLLIRGKNTGVYLHQTTAQHGVVWDVRNNHFIDYNDWYETVRGNSEVTSLFNAEAGDIDEMHFINNFKDGSRADWFGSNDFSETFYNNLVETILTPPAYLNAGLDYEKYKGLWVNSIGEDDSTFISWDLDDEISSKIGTDIKFYKCINAHTSIIGSDPATDDTEWEELTWDEAAIRSDAVGWSSGDIQRYDTPDDFRLPAEDPWNLLCYGINGSAHPNGHTMFKWYIADDASGTNKDLIEYEREANINLATTGNAWLAIQTGKYMIRSITGVNSSGDIGAENFSTGIII